MSYALMTGTQAVPTRVPKSHQKSHIRDYVLELQQHMLRTSQCSTQTLGNTQLVSHETQHSLSLSVLFSMQEA